MDILNDKNYWVSAGSSHVVEFVLSGSVINEICHPGPNDEEVKRNAMSETVQNGFKKYSDEEIRVVYDEVCYVDNNPKATRQEMIEYLLWDACWNAVDAEELEEVAIKRPQWDEPCNRCKNWDKYEGCILGKYNSTSMMVFGYCGFCKAKKN